MTKQIIKDLASKKLLRMPAYPSNLAQLASVLPKDGVGARVMPEDWIVHGNKCFYTLQQVKLTPGFTQGIFTGTLTWNGLQKSSMPQLIPVDLAKKVWRVVPSS
ncbi:hypothetical protein MIR68_001647 [Amoeboaphelidium protococcarum]|nr:hypothetical protein MIR68_001647 [Amoeboaphelidium protococcarum]KAI3646733.1 hypothetical protein MP228_009661 [Amoeboaphelidium protococcarum]